MRVTLRANLTIHAPGARLPEIKAMARWKSREGYTKRVLRLWRWRPELDQVTVPRGLWPLPKSFGPCEVDDQRLLLPEVRFGWRGPELDPYQARAATRLYAAGGGVLVAPTGMGKTLIALRGIAAWHQRCLWIVDTADLAEQAMSRARKVFALASGAFGAVADGRVAPGTHFTVGLRQTLISQPRGFFEQFGSVFCDEVDVSAAESWLRVLSRCRARYRAGATATPKRSDKLEPVVFAMFGPITAAISADQAVAAGRFQVPTIRVVRTGRRYAYGGSWPALQRERALDSERNWQIALHVAREIKARHNCLILVQLIDHASHLRETLQALGVKARVVTGQVGAEARSRRLEATRAGRGQCLIATKLINRGVDLPSVDRLFLADSYRSAPTVEQQIGRVTRTAPAKKDAVVLDFWDDCAQFSAQAQARLRLYRSRNWPVNGDV